MAINYDGRANSECKDYLVRMQQLQDSKAMPRREVRDIRTVRFKKLDESAEAPTQSNVADAGWDLYALESCVIKAGDKSLIKTGIALEIPLGFVGLIWPRSGLAVKKGLDVFAGVVDAGYRGDVGVCLYNSSQSDVEIRKGDRIAQILFQSVPHFRMKESDALTSSDRGEGGFGSSGR